VECSDWIEAPSFFSFHCRISGEIVISPQSASRRIGPGVYMGCGNNDLGAIPATYNTISAKPGNMRQRTDAIDLFPETL
jgi:hypothetical protein